MSTSPALPGCSPMIDTDFIAQLVDAVGPESYRDLIASLTAEVESNLAILKFHTSNGEPSEVKKCAHRLAGMMTQFGAFEVARVAHSVMLTVEASEIASRAAALGEACSRSLAAITAGVDDICPLVPPLPACGGCQTAH